MTPLTTSSRAMRLRAAALTLALAALLPAAASSQQLAVASETATFDASAAAAAAPISKRDRVSLESRLQHVALLQELYWTEHHSYATDMADLVPTSVVAPRDIEILSATAEGWTARVELPTRPGIGCVLTVGTPVPATTGSVVASGGTANGKRLSDPKPPIVCDR